MRTEPAWCIVNTRAGLSNPFGPYATQAEAEELAAELRRFYPTNTYRVQRDPHFRICDIPPPGLAPDSARPEC